MSDRPEIIQGSDRTLQLTMRDSNGDGIDLTNETEITVRFKKTDGTWLEKTMTGSDVTVTNAKLGKISVDLTDTETALIEAGQKVDFHVYLDNGTDRRIVRFNQQIDVIEID